MIRPSKKLVKIGGGPHIDEGVLVGYPPLRKIKNRRLVLGKNSFLRSGTVIYAGSKIGDDFS